MSGDTTHKIQYEQPSEFSAMPLNKAAQFLLGVGILAVAIKLWWSGWFAFSVFRLSGIETADGLGNPIGLLPFLIDAVCFVGILGFTVFGLIRGTIGPLFGGMREWIAVASASQSATNSATSAARKSVTIEVPQQRVDSSKLSAAIQNMNGRIKTLEDFNARVRDIEATNIALTQSIEKLQKWTIKAEQCESIRAVIYPPAPPEPPTAEELAIQIAELREKLEAATVTKTTKAK